MPENNSLDVLIKSCVRQINNADIVGVNVDSFIAYNQFFVLFFFITENKYVCISDIQLIF